MLTRRNRSAAVRPALAPPFEGHGPDGAERATFAAVLSGVRRPFPQSPGFLQTLPGKTAGPSPDRTNGGPPATPPPTRSGPGGSNPPQSTNPRCPRTSGGTQTRPPQTPRPPIPPPITPRRPPPYPGPDESANPTTQPEQQTVKRPDLPPNNPPPHLTGPGITTAVTRETRPSPPPRPPSVIRARGWPHPPGPSPGSRHLGASAPASHRAASPSLRPGRPPGIPGHPRISALAPPPHTPPPPCPPLLSPPP